jgi:hypothetical protein
MLLYVFKNPEIKKSSPLDEGPLSFKQKHSMANAVER